MCIERRAHEIGDVANAQRALGLQLRGELFAIALAPRPRIEAQQEVSLHRAARRRVPARVNPFNDSSSARKCLVPAGVSRYGLRAPRSIIASIRPAPSSRAIAPYSVPGPSRRPDTT